MISLLAVSPVLAASGAQTLVAPTTGPGETFLGSTNYSGQGVSATLWDLTERDGRMHSLRVVARGGAFEIKRIDVVPAGEGERRSLPGLSLAAGESRVLEVAPKPGVILRRVTLVGGPAPGASNNAQIDIYGLGDGRTDLNLLRRD